MNYLMKLLVGLVFILSGLSKLFPIEFFELVILKHVNLPYLTLPFISRGIIGLELALGILLILNVNPRQITVFSSIVLLLLFTFLLIFQIQAGDTENCGCFGELIPMTPMQSAWKNLLLLALLIWVYLKSSATNFKIKWIWVPLVLAITAIPFPIRPILVGYSDEHSTHEKIEWANFSEQDLNQLSHLQTGKHIVALFSASCVHCKRVAEKLSVITSNEKLNNVFALVAGSDETYAAFMQETKMTLSHVHLQDYRYFLKLSKGVFPTILHLNDGVVTRRYTGSDFNYFKLNDILSHETYEQEIKN